MTDKSNDPASDAETQERGDLCGVQAAELRMPERGGADSRHGGNGAHIPCSRNRLCAAGTPSAGHIAGRTSQSSSPSCM